MGNDRKLAGHKRALRREAYQVLDTRRLAALRGFLASWWREGGAEAYAAEVLERARDDQHHEDVIRRRHRNATSRPEPAEEHSEATEAVHSTRRST